MTSKDWKKIGTLKWTGIKRGRIINVIYIDRKKVPLSWFGKKEELEYGVHIGYDVEDDEKVIDRSEYFKTKSQALKYAKEYMRKN
jgi:hypothetical protein